MLKWADLPEKAGNLGREDMPSWRLGEKDLQWLWNHDPGLRGLDSDEALRRMRGQWTTSWLMNNLPTAKAPGLLGGSRDGSPTPSTEADAIELTPLMSGGQPANRSAMHAPDDDPDAITPDPLPTTGQDNAVTWTNPPARDPGSANGSAPSGPAQSVSMREVSWAAQMVPVLEMRLAQARSSGLVEGVAALEEAVAQLRARVVAARRSGGTTGSGVVDRLVAADPAQVSAWLDSSELEAVRLARMANEPGVDAARRVELSRAAVLFNEFPLWAGALGREWDALTGDDFLPLAQVVFGYTVDAVSDELLARLDQHIEALLDDGRAANVAGLVRKEALAQQQTAPLAAEVEAVIAQVAPGADLAARERRLELRALISAFDANFGFDQSNVDDVRALDRLVSATYRYYDKHRDGERPLGLLGPNHLRELLTHKLGTGVEFSWTQLARVADRVSASDTWRRQHRLSAWLGHAAHTGVVKVGLSGTTVFQRKAAARTQALEKAPGRSDSPQERAAEAEELWQEVLAGYPDARVSQGPLGPTATVQLAGRADPVTVSKRGLKDLMEVRRKFYADPRDRRFVSLADYAPMVLEVLGTSGPVSATDLVLLAEALGRARSLTAEGLASLSARLRVVAGTVTIRQLLAESVIRGWSSELPKGRPTLPGESDEHGKYVSAFHTIGELAFVDELTGWLNGIVPMADGALEVTMVRRKLTSLFAQTLDDGSQFTIKAGGREFDVRLWAVPTKPPQVREDSLLSVGTPGSSRFPGKQENRIYQYWDAASSSGWSGGWSFDLGPAYRIGFDPTLNGGNGLDAGEASWTFGGSRSSGRQKLSAVSRSNYQFQRIKEPLGWVELPVTWVARVEETGSGRWKDFIWLDENGAPREDTVPYSVAEFQLPYTLEQLDQLDEALRNNIDPGYLTKQNVSRPEEFPLWKLDHAVSRVQLAEKVLSGLRGVVDEDGTPLFGPRQYAFWKPVLEAYLTNDAMAMGLADILRPRGDADRDFQSVFRVLLQRDGQTLSLSLTATREQPVTSVTAVSEISRSGETRFDQILAVVVKSLMSRDAGWSARTTLAALLRFLPKVFRVGGRAAWTPVRRGKQRLRHHRAWLTRAKRLVGRLQVLLIEFDARLDVALDQGGGITTGRADVSGYAHVLMAAADLRELRLVSGQPLTQKPTLEAHQKQDADEDAKTALDRAPDLTKAWWWLGKEFGIGMDFVAEIGGVDRLYNEVVQTMAQRGYLPAEALGGVGQTPWEYLQSLPLTGAALNKPEVSYRNWLKLVEHVSERSLAIRADDVFGLDADEPGVTLVFASPDGSTDLVLSLGAELESTSQHEGIHSYQIQYGHTSVDTVSAKQSKGRSGDGGGYAALNLMSLDLPKLAFIPLRGQGGGQGSVWSTEKYGRTQSTAVTSDTDGQKMPSARYRVRIRWTWTAEVGAQQVGNGTFPADLRLFQPDTLHDQSGGPGRKPLRHNDGSELDLTTEGLLELAGRSVLTDLTAAIYTVIGASGVGALRKAVVRNGVSSVDARLTLTKAVYKTAALRSLAGVATIPVGDELSLTTLPVGRPQVEKVWFPYTQQILESQAGKEQSLEAGRSAGVSGSGGFALPNVSGLWGSAKDWGQSSAEADLYTVGSYRGVYQDTRMAVVRTAVVNTVTLPDGTLAHANGQLVMNVLLTDVLARSDEFDDPKSLLAEHQALPVVPALPALTRALSTQSHPPLSVQDGFSWSVVWPMLYSGGTEGLGPLTQALTEAATRLGGPALATQVASLPGWLSPYMPKLRDGGARWEFTVGSEVFELVMSAHLVGPARAGRDGGTGQKLYARGNQYRDDRKKTIVTTAKGPSVIGSGTVQDAQGADDFGTRPGLSVVESVRAEGLALRGSNLLFMVGLRANKLSDFNQAVRFRYRIRRLTAALTARPRVDHGEVVEEHVVTVAKEGVLAPGTPPLGAWLTVKNVLPADFRLTGIFGLQAIFDTVRRTGVGRVVGTGSLPVSDDQLTFENLPDKFVEMLTPQGARVHAVALADQTVQVRSGIRVKARFGPVKQLYYMEKAENENYDHGTDLAALSDSLATPRKIEFGGNILFIPAGPGLAGVRAVYADQRGDSSGTDKTDWIEHRAWLRSDTSVYFVYMTLTYDVILASGATRRTTGAIELVVDQAGALALGIPLSVLKAAVPASQRAKEFPGDTSPAREVPALPAPQSTEPDDLALVQTYRDAMLALDAVAKPGEEAAALAAVELHARDAGIAWQPEFAEANGFAARMAELIAERRAHLYGLTPAESGYVNAALERMNRAADALIRARPAPPQAGNASSQFLDDQPDTPEPSPAPTSSSTADEVRAPFWNETYVVHEVVEEAVIVVPDQQDDQIITVTEVVTSDVSTESPDRPPTPIGALGTLQSTESLYVPARAGVFVYTDPDWDGDPDGVIATYVPWLPRVNTVRPGGRWSPDSPLAKQTNCLMATMATHRTLVDRANGEDVFYEVGDTGYGHDGAWSYGVGVPVPIDGGFDQVVEVMTRAPVGAAAELRFTPPGADYQHAVLVWKAPDGNVLFLDGQWGTLAKLPEGSTSVALKPYTYGLDLPYPPVDGSFFLRPSPDMFFRKIGSLPTPGVDVDGLAADPDLAPASTTITEYELTAPGQAQGETPVEHIANSPFVHRESNIPTVAQGADNGAATFPVFRPDRSLKSDTHPPLRVSSDGTLAIAERSGLPKVIYADQRVVTRARERLRQIDSPMDLVMSEETFVEFQHGGEARRLFKVRPEFKAPPPDTCKDFSAYVLGKGESEFAYVLLRDTRPGELGGTGTAALAAILTSDSSEVTGTHAFIDRLVDDSQQSPELTAHLGAIAMSGQGIGKGPWPTPGEKYGQSLHPGTDPQVRDRLDKLAKSLGINQYAHAEVGDGYLVQAISSGETDGMRRFSRDFAREPDPQNPFSARYGYHFSSVVLESLDGQHQVAIENANVSASTNSVLREALARNVAHHGPGISHILQELRNSEGDQSARTKLAMRIKQIYELQQDQASGADVHRELEQATRAGVSLLNEMLGDHTGHLWWLRMYGRAPAESIFAWSMNHPSLANPAAFVVLSGWASTHGPLGVRFQPNGDVTPASHQLLGDVAKGVALVAWRRARLGMPLPTVRITGHALPGEAATVVERMAKVAGVWQALLAESLTERYLDGQTVGQQVSVDDISLSLELEAVDAKPATNRRLWPRLGRASKLSPAKQTAPGRVIELSVDDEAVLSAGGNGAATQQAAEKSLTDTLSPGVSGQAGDPLAVAEAGKQLAAELGALKARLVKQFGLDADPLSSTLGPDPFRLRQPSPTPPFLKQYPFDQLTAAHVPEFFARISLTRTQPRRGDLVPGTEDGLPASGKVTTVKRSGAARKWLPGRNELLPETLSIPHVIHYYWVGDPLVDEEPMAAVRDNVAATARRYKGSFVSAVWTDQPRWKFDAVRNTPRADLAPELRPIRDMLDWAVKNEILLINEDEVYSADAPGPLHPYVTTEANKASGSGHAAKSDLRRMEIVDRFGGVYIDGTDTEVVDGLLADLLRVLTSGPAIALGTATTGISNAVLISPARHPLWQLAYAKAKANYLKTQDEIIDGQVMPGQRPRSVVFRTGPKLLGSVVDSLGLDDEEDAFPDAPSIQAGWAGTWHKGWRASAWVVEAGRHSDLWIVQRAVTALLRDLTVNRPGDLNLALVEPAVSRSARPEVIWSAVVRFIADDPSLRTMVHTVTTRWLTTTGVREVSLPPDVLELVEFESEAPPTQLVRPARLRGPSSASDGPPLAGSDSGQTSTGPRAQTSSAALTADADLARWRAVDVPADGDCLFSAVVLSAELQGVPLPEHVPGSPRQAQVDALRRHAFDQLNADPDRFRGVVERSVAQLIVDDVPADLLWKLTSEPEPPPEHKRAEWVQSIENQALRVFARQKLGQAADDRSIAELRGQFPLWSAPALDESALLPYLAAYERAERREELLGLVDSRDEPTLRQIERYHGDNLARGPARAAELARTGMLPRRRPGDAGDPGSLALLGFALREASLWNSAIGDDVPRALATALGLNLMVVDSGLRQGFGIDGPHLYLQRQDNHYRALDASDAMTEAATGTHRAGVWTPVTTPVSVLEPATSQNAPRDAPSNNPGDQAPTEEPTNGIRRPEFGETPSGSDEQMSSERPPSYAERAEDEQPPSYADLPGRISPLADVAPPADLVLSPSTPADAGQDNHVERSAEIQRALGYLGIIAGRSINHRVTVLGWRSNHGSSAYAVAQALNQREAGRTEPVLLLRHDGLDDAAIMARHTGRAVIAASHRIVAGWDLVVPQGAWMLVYPNGDRVALGVDLAHALARATRAPEGPNGDRILTQQAAVASTARQEIAEVDRDGLADVVVLRRVGLSPWPFAVRREHVNAATAVQRLGIAGQVGSRPIVLIPRRDINQRGALTAARQLRKATGRPVLLATTWVGEGSVAQWLAIPVNETEPETALGPTPLRAALSRYNRAGYVHPEPEPEQLPAYQAPGDRVLPRLGRERGLRSILATRLSPDRDDGGTRSETGSESGLLSDDESAFFSDDTDVGPPSGSGSQRSAHQTDVDSPGDEVPILLPANATSAEPPHNGLWSFPSMPDSSDAGSQVSDGEYELSSGSVRAVRDDDSADIDVTAGNASTPLGVEALRRRLEDRYGQTGFSDLRDEATHIMRWATFHLGTLEDIREYVDIPDDIFDLTGEVNAALDSEEPLLRVMDALGTRGFDGAVSLAESIREQFHVAEVTNAQRPADYRFPNGRPDTLSPHAGQTEAITDDVPVDADDLVDAASYDIPGDILQLALTASPTRPPFVTLLRTLRPDDVFAQLLRQKRELPFRDYNELLHREPTVPRSLLDSKVRAIQQKIDASKKSLAGLGMSLTDMGQAGALMIMSEHPDWAGFGWRLMPEVPQGWDEAWRSAMPSDAETVDQLMSTVPESISDVPDWVRERIERDQPPVPFLVDDAFDEQAEQVLFGIEIEFVLSQDERTALGIIPISERLRWIGERLFAAGLTSDARQQSYHSSQRRPISAQLLGGWGYEDDPTVHGEIVSPLLKSTPQTWRAVAKIIDVLTLAGARASVNAGFHVHVSAGVIGELLSRVHAGSTGSGVGSKATLQAAQSSPAYLARFALLVQEHVEALWRLSTNPSADRHRGAHYAKPYPQPASGYEPVAKSIVMSRQRHHDALSFLYVEFKVGDHPELRMFDASLIAGVIQTQVRLAVGLALAATDPDSAPLYVVPSPVPLGRFHDPLAPEPPRGRHGWRVFDLEANEALPILDLARVAFSRPVDMLIMAALATLTPWLEASADHNLLPDWPTGFTARVDGELRPPTAVARLLAEVAGWLDVGYPNEVTWLLVPNGYLEHETSDPDSRQLWRYEQLVDELQRVPPGDRVRWAVARLSRNQLSLGMSGWSGSQADVHDVTGGHWFGSPGGGFDEAKAGPHLSGMVTVTGRMELSGDSLLIGGRSAQEVAQWLCLTYPSRWKGLRGVLLKPVAMDADGMPGLSERIASFSAALHASLPVDRRLSVLAWVPPSSSGGDAEAAWWFYPAGGTEPIDLGPDLADAGRRSGHPLGSGQAPSLAWPPGRSPNSRLTELLTHTDTFAMIMDVDGERLARDMTPAQTAEEPTGLTFFTPLPGDAV